MPDDVIHFARWYNERLNPRYFAELTEAVAAATDLSFRRHDNRIGNAYHDIDSKLEQIGYHSYMALERLKLSNALLPGMLSDLATDVERDIDSHRRFVRQVDARVEFYDFVLNAHIEGLLIQSKALLDSTTQFYSIAFKRDVRTFSGSGKNWLKDIGNLPKNAEPYLDRLRNAISTAKEVWIDQLIRYRDEVVHFGQLRDMRGHSLKLDERTRYEPNETLQSTMPGGRPVREFVELILHEAHAFEAIIMAIIFDRLRDSGH